jgi:hypothetical protein
MRRPLLTLVSLALFSLSAWAGQDEDSTIWVSDMKGAADSGWVVSIPAGNSDYFSVSHAVIPGKGDSEQLVDGLPVSGISVSIADFGSERWLHDASHSLLFGELVLPNHHKLKTLGEETLEWRTWGLSAW